MVDCLIDRLFLYSPLIDQWHCQRIGTNYPSHCFLPIAPTAAPVGVAVTAINASRISVTWTKPSKSVLHGNLVRYEVEYRRVVCNEADPVSVADSSWKSINVTNTSLSEEIGNLQFWSCYEVRMRAVTVGNGPYSNVTDVRTKEHGELCCSSTSILL